MIEAPINHILRLQLSIRLSVTEGQRKLLDLETPESVYLGPWSVGSWMAVRALATSTNASFLDRPYYRKTMDILISVVGCRQLSSLIQEKVLSQSSSFRQQILLFASCIGFTYAIGETASELINELLGQLIDQVTCLNNKSIYIHTKGTQNNGAGCANIILHCKNQQLEIITVT